MPVPIPGQRPDGYDESFWSTISDDTASAFKDKGFDWNKLPSDQRDECIRAHNEAMRQSHNKAGD